MSRPAAALASLAESNRNAFAPTDGGLIDITYDEGNPPFTYSGNSFNNANAYGPTLGDQPNASAGIAAA